MTQNLAHPINRNSSVAPRPDEGVTKPAGRMEDLYQLMLGRIRSGELLPGQSLPSIRTQAVAQGVSRDTVLRAYDKLVAGGSARAVRGSGFYVVGPDIAVSTPPPPAPERIPPDDWMHIIHSDIPLDRSPGCGAIRHPPAMRDEVTRALRSVLTNGVGFEGGHGDPDGYAPLRNQLREKLLLDGIDLPSTGIVAVPGAVAGLTIVTRAFLRQGSCALIEDPSPFIHRAVLMAQGVTLRRVPRLNDGPDLDALREHCILHRPRLFLLSSLLQNPTGTSISPQKARRLLEISSEFDLLLIDDASFADLASPGNPRPGVALMPLDGGERVVHVGGFSATIGTASGVGFVAASEQHMRWIQPYRSVHGLGRMVVYERLLYRFLCEGIYRRRCERLRTYLRQCASRLRRALSDASLTLPPETESPYMWLSLGPGCDASLVANRMRSAGFLAAPFVHFSRAPAFGPYMRLNVTTTSAAAVSTLRSCIENR